MTDHTTHRDEALQQQAWAWLRLLNGGDVKPQDAEDFRAWLQDSPTHKAAFNAARARWELLGPVAGELLQTNRRAAQVHARTLQRGSGFQRRAFLGAAIGTAAAAGLAVAYPPAGLWPAPHEWGADLRTATGQQRSVTLAERARVTLNTQTSIRHRMNAEQVTGIDLLTGEAAVDLSVRGPRPSLFTVVAGAGRTQAQAGRFEVRNLAGKVCVTCLDGELQVEHPAGVRRLQANQQAVYDTGSLSEIAVIQAQRVSAWRRGELVFEQARLGDVIDEINRYRPGRVVLLNTAARSKPVSGKFFIATLDRTLSQLQYSFELHARSLPGGLLVLT